MRAGARGMSHLHVTSVFSFFPEPIDLHLVELWISGLSVSLASLRAFARGWPLGGAKTEP